MKARSEAYLSVLSLLIFCVLVKQLQGKWLKDCQTNGTIHDEYCYITMDIEFSYVDAESACNSYGGQIAMMKTSLIQALVVADFRNKNNSNSFWAGITVMKSQDLFEYADGHILTPLNTFRPWAANEPSYNEFYMGHCVAVNHNEQWSTKPCVSNDFFFACQFKRDNSPCYFYELNIPHSEYNPCRTQFSVNYGESLSVKCHEGYVLVGPNNVTCTADSKWSHAPQCIQGCYPLKQLPHATFLNLNATYTLHSRVTYICNDGYVTSNQQSHLQLTCGPNNKWFPENNGCTLKNKYTIRTIEVQFDMDSNHSISITCNACDIEKLDCEGLIDQNESYLWLKNSENINKTNLDFSVNTNGTLTIGTLNEEVLGYYICFRIDAKSTNLTPGHIITEVKLKLEPKDCPLAFNDSKQLTFREGYSFVLTCPHNSSIYDFMWFKDDQQHYIRADQTVFPDGTLYTEMLQYSDQGIYICQLIMKNYMDCKLNHTIQVTVVASSFDKVCGKVDDKYPHPWAVSLLKYDEIAPFCYGVLINELWVVTSADCLVGFNRKKSLNVNVRFGYKEPIFADFINIEVQAVKIHRNFSKKLNINDIGLVQLKHPVLYTRSVRPICLTENDLTIKTPCDHSPTINGTVVGWGPLEKDDYDNYPTLLNETMSTVEMHDTSSRTDHLHVRTIICSKIAEGTETTLAADKGSPLEVFRNGSYYLLGVYSWGERNVYSGDYDYFTKINEYVSWIKSYSEGSD